MADDEVKILQEAKKLPMAERVAHANWKARNAAYEDIKIACQRVIEDTDPCLTEYGGIPIESCLCFVNCEALFDIAPQGACSPRLLATAMPRLRTRHLIVLWFTWERHRSSMRQSERSLQRPHACNPHLV